MLMGFFLYERVSRSLRLEGGRSHRLVVEARDRRGDTSDGLAAKAEIQVFQMETHMNDFYKKIK